jgi:penicillin-binding protein 2
MERERTRVKTSIRVLQTIMLGLGVTMIGRLIQLQIIEHDLYNPISQSNALRQETVTPSRGLIFDRNGELLVDNEPVYTITITPRIFKDVSIPLLATLVGLPEEDVKEKVKAARKYSWHRSSRLFTEVNIRTFSLIQENLWRLPGISHTIESKRSYPGGILASHMFGYLREVSEKEYQQASQYQLGDKIGKTGIEASYERQLRGKNGLSFQRVNAFGQALGTFEQGGLDVAPEKGDDVYTTLQLDIQKLAETLMSNKVGGLVAMNPNDGSILAMVSAPQYNLNYLAGKLNSEYWAQVNADTLTPLFNRAISTRQPPGSTFKPLMGLIGLHLGQITPQTDVWNPGYFYKGREYKDLAPVGSYNLELAIAKSSNTYFFWLMNRIASAGQFNTWHDLLAETGLGQLNNIDLPNERSGILPDSSYFNRAFGKNRWGIGDVINLGVGQGAISASPLQMAVIASEIANGGYWVRPHVVHSLRRPDGTRLEIPPRKQKISWMTTENLDVVKKGMRRAILEGSGRFYGNIPGIEIAGKTGTAQNPHGKDHGWFVCFAPVDNPQIAVACLIENAGFGGLTAAPISSLLVEQYLLGEIKRQNVLKMVRELSLTTERLEIQE